jgi:putative flippase GtrA
VKRGGRAKSRVVVLARSMLAGGAATVADLGALALMVSWLGLAPRVASVPALLFAGSVNFLANRHFAFRAGAGSAAKQARRFVLVHSVTLALNALLFDLALRGLGDRAPYWAVRLVVSNLVYFAWSFPMFKRVFRVEAHA